MNGSSNRTTSAIASARRLALFPCRVHQFLFWILFIKHLAKILLPVFGMLRRRHRLPVLRDDKVFAYRPYEVPGIRGRRHSSAQHRVGMPTWAILRVEVIVIGIEHIAAQIETGKQPLGARIGKELSVEQNIS